MVDINLSTLLRIATDFEEAAAETLRSGEIPFDDEAKTRRMPAQVEVKDYEPESFDAFLDMSIAELKAVKEDIEDALKNIRSFEPEVEGYFHNAQLKLDRAKQYYHQALTV